MTEPRIRTQRPTASRRNTTLRVAILIFCAAGCCGLASAAENQTPEAAIAVEERLAELERQIEALQQALASATAAGRKR